MIPKTKVMDAKEYDPGSTTTSKSFIGHFGIPKNEIYSEESDTEEEMGSDFDDYYSKKYMRDEEDEIENHPVCFCGRLAMKRMSMTTKNPGRWFFNCSKRNFNTQCGYFEWEDELYEDDDYDEYETDDEEVDSNNVEHEDEKMVLSEEKSVLTCQASTVSIKVEQVKEMDLFPQYPDLSLLVLDHKPQIGLDGTILSLALPG